MKMSLSASMKWFRSKSTAQSPVSILATSKVAVEYMLQMIRGVSGNLVDSKNSINTALTYGKVPSIRQMMKGIFSLRSFGHRTAWIRNLTGIHRMRVWASMETIHLLNFNTNKISDLQIESVWRPRSVQPFRPRVSCLSTLSI